MRAQVDRLPVGTITVADELGIETVQGMLQTPVRGFGMYEYYLTDRIATLQE